MVLDTFVHYRSCSRLLQALKRVFFISLPFASQVKPGHHRSDRVRFAFNIPLQLILKIPQIAVHTRSSGFRLSWIKRGIYAVGQSSMHLDWLPLPAGYYATCGGGSTFPPLYSESARCFPSLRQGQVEKVSRTKNSISIVQEVAPPKSNFPSTSHMHT